MNVSTKTSTDGGMYVVTVIILVFTNVVVVVVSIFVTVIVFVGIVFVVLNVL